MDSRIRGNDGTKESYYKMSDGKDLNIKFTEITAKDLPLHCPTAAVAAWSSHPRVFLDIVKTGQVACPYCGTKYKLKAGEHFKSY